MNCFPLLCGYIDLFSGDTLRGRCHEPGQMYHMGEEHDCLPKRMLKLESKDCVISQSSSVTLPPYTDALHIYNQISSITKGTRDAPINSFFLEVAFQHLDAVDRAYLF